MSSKGSKYKREDIEFMSEVDAALRYRGHPYAYILSFFVFIVLLVFTLWAYFAVLDEVTRGMGQVIPSQRTQEIQNLEGGILSDILVSEGEIVDKGTILVRIDNEQARSLYREAHGKSLEHIAAITRLEAELNGVEPVFSEEIKKDAPQMISDQMRIFQSRKNQYENDMKVLQSQLKQREQEVGEMISRQSQLANSYKIAADQRNIARPLMESGIYDKMSYLQLEERLVSIKGDMDTLALSIPRSRTAVEEASSRLEQRKAELRNSVSEEINKRRVELNSLREMMSAGEDKVVRTDVRSSVKGTVKRININTKGGVIRPGDTIIEIVPIDDTLLIEARIRPADIAFLHPGQKAMVKITAYDFSIYGGLEGSLENISADTIEDKRGENFFLVKLRTTKNAIVYRGEKLPIIPGMTASVDILTGKKSVLDYLLKPIIKAKQNALKER